MASPEKPASVVRFVVAEGVRASEILSRLLIKYGKSCINHAKVYKRVERFKAAEQ